MQNKKLLTFLTAAIVFTTSSAYAADTEYCVVTNKNGDNVVKAGQADCNSMIKMNCKVGDNVMGDKHAAILVPKGQCDKIKEGDFNGMSKSDADLIKSKIDMRKLTAPKM